MSNQYAQELLKLVDNYFAIDSDTMDTAEWITQNTKLKGRPFTFTKYPFQKQIVNDWHVNLSVKKISQIGLTEVQIRKALAFLTRNKHTTLIFSFPDDDMRKRNSQTRIQPLLEENEVFNKGIGVSPVRSMQLNQIGTSFLHITGTKESDATSTSADVVMQDEIDLGDPKMQTLMSSRLQGSDWKINQKFSTPTYTGFGIDAAYNGSDQHEYQIKCSCCNHWQFPLFDPRWVRIPNISADLNDLTEIDQHMVNSRGLDLLNAEVVCEKCGSVLDLGGEVNREYVAKYPSRKHSRGYRLNCFSTNTLSIAYIVGKLLEYKRNDFLRGFKNTVLGESDDSSSNRISEENIEQIMRGMNIPEIKTDIPTWVGIDMGQTVHMTVGQGWTLDKVRIVRLESFHVDELPQRVQFLLDNYWVMGGLIDRHPYEPTADAVRDQTNSLIMPCEYRGSAELRTVKNEFGQETHLQANRTMLLDEVKKAVNNKTLTIDGYQDKKETYKTHLRNMVREEEPEKEATWRKLDNEDHFFHSTGFMLSAIKYRMLSDMSDQDVRSSLDMAVADMNGYDRSISGILIPSKTKGKDTWAKTLL